MFKVTSKEENAVMRIQGVYTSLQIAADKVARTLLFDSAITAASQKHFFKFSSERKQKIAAREEKCKLLEVITLLKAELEACQPTIAGDHLYFKCRLVDTNEFDTDRFRTSEANSSVDMVACFEELERRMSKMLDYPEVAEVVQNTSNYAYCPCFATPNLGISQFFKTYIKELKADEEAKPTACGVQNPNTSHRKKARRSKKNRKKHQ